MRQSVRLILSQMILQGQTSSPVALLCHVPGMILSNCSHAWPGSRCEINVTMEIGVEGLVNAILPYGLSVRGIVRYDLTLPEGLRFWLQVRLLA